MTSLRSLNIISNLKAVLHHRELPIVISKRFASRPKLNTHQNRKAPGVKRLDGDYVRPGEVLVKQFYLHFHPGLNVEIDSRNNTLVSMREGLLIFTCEKVNPNDSPVALKYYQNLSIPLYKKYVNIIPFKQGTKFDLVDLV